MTRTEHPGASDPRISRWLSKERPWRDELVALREILLEEGLTETLKWRAPCYMASGGNVAILATLADAAALSFFKGVLLDDPDGLLVPPGPNSRSARYVKVGSVGAVEAHAARLRRFIRQAIEIEASGRTVPLEDDDLALPDELAAALSADPALSAAWDALTPGRRRGYVVQIGGARKSETRAARVRKWRSQILEGRGLHDR